jgi:hypothetical protein
LNRMLVRDLDFDDGVLHESTPGQP